ncbi:NAD(P)H-binding protein [Streptomyces sp. NPDC059985]|uniref:NAD(P)H-binding protein n=1 Tax=Streptomyces sp. NPDC059985 TaxID=3347025 RepID=UPI0036AA5692
MTKQQQVLVLGGTGKTGRRVVARLAERGHEVRVGSRKGPAPFDWNDVNTWERALEGVDAAYLVDSQLADAATSMRSFAELAVSRGVRRLVLLSARDWVVPDGEEKLPCERAVRESGAEWTVLKPAWFAQNFSEDPFFRAQLLSGDVVMSTGEGSEPFVDADDIADVAVAALTEDGHAGRSYALTGPRPVPLREVTDSIARATGRSIVHRPVSPEDFATYAAERHGLPADYVDLLNTLYGWIGDDLFAEPAEGVRQALGRAPRDFSAYVTSTAGTGVWHG